MLTIYGPGKVRDYRPSDGMYQVMLPFGVCFAKPSAILGAEELSPSALTAIGISVDPHGVERIFAGSVAPVENASSLVEPCRIFFGTQQCYLFMRMHHTLYSRLSAARDLSSFSQKDVSQGPEGEIQIAGGGLDSGTQPPLANMDASDDEGDMVAGVGRTKSSYSCFLGQLVGSIEGSIDSSK